MRDGSLRRRRGGRRKLKGTIRRMWKNGSIEENDGESAAAEEEPCTAGFSDLDRIFLRFGSPQWIFRKNESVTLTLLLLITGSGESSTMSWGGSWVGIRGLGPELSCWAAI